MPRHLDKTTKGETMKGLLAALPVAIALLGLGTYFAALEVAWSRAASDAAVAGDWRLQFAGQTAELGRPICRRNNFANRERPLLRINENCL